MAITKAERLVNLVICLLATRQYLPAARVRQTVEGYDGGTDEAGKEAFQRMFERDKSELRELGVPLETGTNSVLDAEAGYRIARRDYELPEVRLDAEEAAAVGLAARLWQSGLAAQASSAVVKLRAAGVDVDPDATLGIEPVVDAGDPALGPALQALTDRRAVRFAYRTGGHVAQQEQREVEPWGVVSAKGRWYLAGHDRNRDATRVFRLSRIVGPLRPYGPAGAVQVPGGLDLPAMVANTPGEPRERARLRVRRGAAAGLRRHAVDVTEDGGQDLLTVGFYSVHSFAEQLVGYGPDVLVLEPAELRSAVVDRLRAVAGTAQE